ncbi:glycosyltransferase [Catalinimonas niigatensis]|uniref:glycosyltransferase n=1 Tax=Catalinimonas niigatensis TaxID=1397264 RepID=UPI002664F73E|nr:glycosyltransferase [Catalinimonas niigatensis]WPP53320.1 glycosyltransferase [Catalinimonas niigatensis]
MASSIIILIAVAGKSHALDKVLNSLTQCKKPDNYRGTIVIENGIKYNAESIVRKYESVLTAEYLYFPRGNKSAALNYALNNIDDPTTLIFFTDDDGYIEKNTLLGYESASREISSRHFFGGSMKVEYEKTPPAWLKDSLPPSAKGWEPNGNDDYLSTPRFLGINWAAFAGDVKRLGGFNENLGPGTKPKRTGQEWDMQNKMLKAGFNAVYVENAVAWHYVPKEKCSLGWLIKRRFQNGFGAGISFVESKGRKEFPLEIVKPFIKSCILLPVNLFSLSRARMVVSLSHFSLGLGGIKGYFTAYFSNKF